ncbi:MAG: glucose-6-phosphate isomerase [Pseudomonadota bacterium]
MSIPSLSELSTAMRAARDTGLVDLFAGDESRAHALSFRAAGLLFDVSKLHVTQDVLSAGARLAESMQFEAARAALLSGAIVNASEKRPAVHAAMRGDGADWLSDQQLASQVKAAARALEDFAQAFESRQVRTPEGKPYTSLIHLGIGGSALGPQMLLEALSGMGLAPALKAHVVANIDAAALMPVLEQCDPAATLVVLASKSFTTAETLTNAATVEAWMTGAGVTDPRAQMVAVTASPQKAEAYGLPKSQILAFPEAVGGRYSIWSAVSVPAVLAYGYEAFAEFLAGAGQMDAHFREAPFAQNVPAIAALMDLAYANGLGAQSRATFAYDQRLALLPSYLQQLETESNGKHVGSGGALLACLSSPVVWGGVGTDAQHAVFQLLHQGTHVVPTEFIVCARPQHSEMYHHHLLLSNCLAQSAALMTGRTPEQAAQKLGVAADDPLAVAKSFPGNRPSTTILMDALTPASLGALIAFYEHRVFTFAALIGINPFDQMGVELGKEMAKALENSFGNDAVTPANADPSTVHLLKYINAALNQG